MQTPASVYEPSPRAYPSRLPEIEYPDAMLVRTVRSHGHFRWNKHDVFLSEVLWGERIGLQTDDDEIFTVYFAHLPLALLDARTATLYPLPKHNRANAAFCASGQACPEAQSKNKNLPDKEKVSEMRPV